MLTFFFVSATLKERERLTSQREQSQLFPRRCNSLFQLDAVCLLLFNLEIKFTRELYV